MEVRDDAEYVDMLTTLSEGSVRRNFNPYTDIDWDSPEFAVIPNDTRWVLPATDPLGGHEVRLGYQRRVRHRLGHDTLADDRRTTSPKAVQLGAVVGGPGGSPARMSILTVAL